MAALANRMAHELRVLAREPPEGVSAAPADGAGDSITRLSATLQGPPGTVYEGGWFRVSVVVPERFPFEPPKVTFDTRVYHPNIDARGRVCLDLLDMPPKGSWRPSLTLATVLAGVRQLLADPNPRDPLEPDVTEEYLNNRALFELKARQMVARCASAPPAAADDGEAAAAAVGGGDGGGAGGGGRAEPVAAMDGAGGGEGDGEGSGAAAAAAAAGAAAEATTDGGAAAAAVAAPPAAGAGGDAVPSPSRDRARASGSQQQQQGAVAASASPAAKRARLVASGDGTAD